MKVVKLRFIKNSLMGLRSLIYKKYGYDTILIEWEACISPEILWDIQSFVERIERVNVEGIREMNFVYHSLLVVFDSEKIGFEDLKKSLENIYEQEDVNFSKKRTLYNIPVCYNSHFGLDLEFLAKEKQCGIQDIIRWHTEATYIVYGIGFLPGFLYLGGLSSKLHSPRRNIPRLNVMKGAVGIGGEQTGIYPKDTPGGWHIIGNSPISFFNPDLMPPCFVKVGDRIRFFEVDLVTHKYILEEGRKGTYEIEREVWND